ncbi:MAG: diacylglycerol kinase family lipid kinase [Bacteroidales bacterium]|nr:diacylglycerol kinase family lipid kinase [Bacteroidales bacterium]
MKQKISFIINPISGTRKKSSWPGIIRKRINERRFDIEIFFTERRGHAFELARQQVANKVPYIIAVGGDGTVNEVATALRDTESAMGIIPSGSGNGLARHLHIPLRLGGALKVVNAAKTICIDYGMANGHPFFCTLGTGFDAHVSDVFAHTKKRGFLKYVSIIGKEFITYRSQEYTLDIDGDKFDTDAMLVTVANSSQYGNNGYIAPHANIADGRLDVCILKPFPKVLASDLAFRLISKTIHKSPYYHTRKAERIIIKRKTDDPIHLDGDPFEMDETLDIKIVPHGLKVLIK